MKPETADRNGRAFRTSDGEAVQHEPQCPGDYVRCGEDETTAAHNGAIGKHSGGVRTAIVAGYNRNPIKFNLKEIVRRKRHHMNAKRQEHFKRLLLSELQLHAQHVGEEQARALEIDNDDAGGSDLALRDVIQGLALKLGDRESKAVADIDQALMRMKEGSYGLCVRCGEAIDERRLEAVPTARYDAACQTEIENAKGQNARPSL